MKNNKFVFYKSSPRVLPVLFFLLLILMSAGTLSFFFPVKVLASAEVQKVYDYYGLFSDEEISDLEEICSKYGEDGKVDIVIVTNDLNGQSAKKYLEDFYDEYGFGYDTEYGDTAIILLDMYDANRTVTIQGYGKAEYYLNNDRIEHILDDVTEFLKNGEYFDALEEFAKQTAYYMNESKGVSTSKATGKPESGNYYGESGYAGPSNYYGQKKDNIFYNSFFQLGIAVIIGGVTVAIMAAGSGGRITVSNRTYLDEGSSGVTASRDDYIRTTVTKVKKPDNDNNQITGGGLSSGGGGISSGGHSHSGGSRSF